MVFVKTYEYAVFFKEYGIAETLMTQSLATGGLT